MTRHATRFSRKLVDILDNDGRGVENTVWLCRRLQERGIPVQFQYHVGDPEPGFHRIFVHVRYLELAKAVIQVFGTKAPQEAPSVR